MNVQNNGSTETGVRSMSSDSFKVISLFSGAMGLDLGLEQAGLETAVCVEIDPVFCATIRQNRPDTPVLEADISHLDVDEVLGAAGLSSGEAFAVVGGPPCQSFSTGGLRQSIRDKRGSLFAEFFRVVDQAQPLYFVFENVAQLVTAAVKHRPISERPGQRWHLSSYKNESGVLTAEEQAGSALDVILDEFDQLGYSLNFAVLNAADYGAPQKRLRFILIGSRIQHKVEFPEPTHAEHPHDNGLEQWQTLKDALDGLDEDQPMHSDYSPEFRRFFQLIPPGGNWRNLPDDLQREALGEKSYRAGGGKTGFFRRLSWEAPAPTIVGKPNRKSSAICHPEEIRPLSVREAARVQGFPDQWSFCGSMHKQYLQIGNAVPVQLGRAIGHRLLDAYQEYELLDDASMGQERLHDWRSDRESMLTAANSVLRAAARNKRAKKKSNQPRATQKSLFE